MINEIAMQHIGFNILGWTFAVIWSFFMFGFKFTMNRHGGIMFINIVTTAILAVFFGITIIQFIHGTFNENSAFVWIGIFMGIIYGGSWVIFKRTWTAINNNPIILPIVITNVILVASIIAFFANFLT
jgi:hypothetical protein